MATPYTLKHLNGLLAVARCGSFIDASRQLHITRPALSILIRELEDRLGFALFRRTTRAVALTEEGQAFLPHAERVIHEYESSVWVARHISQQGRGVFAVACSQLMASALMPDAIQAFKRDQPQTDVQLLDLPNDEIIQAVLSGRAEVGIGPERYMPNTISASVLFSAPLGCLCAHDHPFAKSNKATWKDMAKQTIISGDRGGWLMVMRDLNYEMNFSTHIEVQSAMTGISLVSRNLGVMSSTSFIAPFLSALGVRYVPLTDPVLERRTMLYTRAGATLSPVAQWFCDLLSKMPSPPSPQRVTRGRKRT